MSPQVGLVYRPVSPPLAARRRRRVCSCCVSGSSPETGSLRPLPTWCVYSCCVCLSHVAASLNRTGCRRYGLYPGSRVDKLNDCFCLTLLFAPPERATVILWAWRWSHDCLHRWRPTRLRARRPAVAVALVPFRHCDFCLRCNRASGGLLGPLPRPR